MINLLIALLVSVTSICSAAQWTFHGFKDNYSAVTWTDFSEPITYLCMSWDWAWDQAGLGTIDSGTRTLVNSIGGITDSGFTGYSDVLSLDVPDGFVFLTLSVTSGYPDYNGDYSNLPFPKTSGEYWLDMDSTGSPRLSTSQPTDFGKWAWDGSINPNYVAPAAVHGKSHIKKH